MAQSRVSRFFAKGAALTAMLSSGGAHTVSAAELKQHLYPGPSAQADSDTRFRAALDAENKALVDSAEMLGNLFPNNYNPPKEEATAPS